MSREKRLRNRRVGRQHQLPRGRLLGGTAEVVDVLSGRVARAQLAADEVRGALDRAGRRQREAA